MPSTRPYSNQKLPLASHTGSGHAAVIVQFSPADGPAERLTIGYAPSSRAAADSAADLNALHDAVQRCFEIASEGSMSSHAASLDDVERRLLDVIEQAERHVNRSRQNLDQVDSGAVHRIFHEMVRGLRSCRATIVNHQVSHRSLPYIGLVRIRQHLSEVLRTVQSVARSAHREIASTG